MRLDRRLGVIAGGLELDADSNPIGAEHIGAAVHEALATSELAPEVRLVLIKLCERDLTPLVAKLYETLDQRLVRAGVLPAAQGGATRAPSRGPAPSARNAAEALFEQVPEEPHGGPGAG